MNCVESVLEAYNLIHSPVIINIIIKITADNTKITVLYKFLYHLKTNYNKYTIRNHQRVTGLTKAEEIKQLCHQNMAHTVSACLSSMAIVPNNLLSNFKHI